jgi:hypothetical protein
MLFLSSNYKEERAPILGRPQLLVQYSRSYRRFLKYFMLHLKPEDEPR